MKYDGPTDVLKQDDALPSQNQYTYIGSILGEDKVSKTKFVFHCSECAKDKELFGNSLFYTDRVSYNKGNLFCGCAKIVRWTEAQAVVKCKRASEKTGHIFEGLVLPYTGVMGRAYLQCSICAHRWSVKLSNFWSIGRGCISCREVKWLAASRQSTKKIKSDETMINSFISSGAFKDGTTFTRISRKTKDQKSRYWEVWCPDCTQTWESQQGHLQLGRIGCACGRSSQTEAYINVVYDKATPIALKFGISKNSNNRLDQHNYHSIYDHELFAIYKFESVSECKSAERFCKDTIPRGVITQEEMEFGWTETCHTNYLDSVMNIFSSMGGNRIL